MPALERPPSPVESALLHGAESLAERLRASVVAVGGRRGVGAGTVWRPGLVVTNHHVARTETMRVEPAPGSAVEPFEARVLARDLAALAAPAGADLPAVATREAASLRAGELVVAVGHPWGERAAFSAGVVLTTGEPAGEHAVPLAESVRADVRLAPGNSGGPLADARGRVVGVNSMIAGGSAVAIPSEAVERFLARLDARGGEASQRHAGFLGIAARPVDAGDAEGLLITEIVPASPAEAAGLLPGDIVLAIGEARGLEAMASALRDIEAGRPLRLDLLRGGRRVAVEVRSGEPPQAWPWSA
jgi:serine protease Do